MNFKTKISLILLTIVFAPVSAAYASASIYLSPSSGTYYLGNTFTTSILTNTGGSRANAFSATISYPADRLEVVNIAAGSSLCVLLVNQPSFDNSAGRAQFTCGRPSPGYSGAGGLIGTLTFRAKTTGAATVSVSGGQVLADDGQGTNLLSSRGSANYNISVPPAAAPVVNSGSHPDETKWYNVNDAEFNWQGAAGTIYSFSFNQVLETIPPESMRSSETAASYADLTEGVWYFHLRSFSNGNWSTTRHFKIQIDNTPPDELIIETDPEGKSAVAPLISFNATDALSGIEKYEIRFDYEDEWQEVESPYIPERIRSGERTIYVRAYDRAGNMIEESTKIFIEHLPVPSIKDPKSGALFKVAEEFTISGVAQPNSLVTIFLNGEPIFEGIRVDASGTFSVKYEPLLLPGIYTLTAVVESNGVMSEESEPIQFTLDSALLSVGPFRIRGDMAYTAAAGAVVVVSGASSWFFLAARRRNRKVEKAIIDELEHIAHELGPEGAKKIKETEQHIIDEFENKKKS